MRKWFRAWRVRRELRAAECVWCGQPLVGGYVSHGRDRYCNDDHAGRHWESMQV